LGSHEDSLAPTAVNWEANIVQAYEPRPGMKVRIQEGHWRSEFGGSTGTVEHRWGHPDHPALDVRLEDGRLVLFWFHELDQAG
jgi:hypothetical protein